MSRKPCRQRLASLIAAIVPLALLTPLPTRAEGTPPVAVVPVAAGAIDPLLGVRSPLARDWVGLRSLPANTPILVMAGHADAQNIAGSGTSGAAVALRGARPMMAGISDELYWNMVIAQAVVQLGEQRGLTIRYHRPPYRTISDGDAPGTNWSAGREHVAAGGYALEIHFDAYGPSGVGSGLIPPLHRPFSRVDESLAQAFGGYPMNFRERLGGPKRGLALLEIGKLEGPLEDALRDPQRRAATVSAIAGRVVQALAQGLGLPEVQPAEAAPASPVARRRRRR
ncbi:MAG: dehydrogenase [Cyanobacteriota bacterium]|nr:dehydrogenase [Cyanobacteriota bacterium]